MNLGHRPTKVLVTGASGSGKSTLSTGYILASDYLHKFVYDHEGEFAQRTGFNVCLTGEQLQQSLTQPYTIFDPSELFPGDSSGGFDFFCEYCFEVSKTFSGKKLFCCDELQKLTGTDVVSLEFSTLIETGRRHEIDFIAVSQQPNLIHNRIRNQFTDIISFRQIEEMAVRYLGRMGFDDDELRNLRIGDYIEFRVLTTEFNRGNIFGLTKKPVTRKVSQSEQSQDSRTLEGSTPESSGQTIQR